MRKNVAGQMIGAQLVSATDGSAFTGAVTVFVTGDAGTQATGSVGSGACTHEGNGYHTYAPAQAETNYTIIAFTFTGSGAVPVTVQVFTTGYDPTAAQIPANVTQFGGSNGTFSGGRPEVNTTHAAGTAWASGAITAAVIATGAIDADAIADNAIDAGAIADNAITAAKIANGAIDAATFAADVDAEILSYLVDDATRIDASALNTLSGHDPGETIMGATDLGTGSGLTSLATAAELAKVPKSDSNVTWNATAAAQLQSEAADALVAYDPPTRAEATADKDEILAATADVQTTADAVETDTQDIQSRLPAALVKGRMDSHNPKSRVG